MRLHYTPGVRLLVATPGLAFLTGDEALAARMWDAARRTDSFEGLLVELVHEGLAGLPSFVLVDGRDPLIRVLVRGELTARVGPPSEAIDLTATGVTTWAERAFDRGNPIEVGGHLSDASSLPLIEGIVRCTGFRWDGADSRSPGSSDLSTGRHLAAVPTDPPSVPGQKIMPPVSTVAASPLIKVRTAGDVAQREPSPLVQTPAPHTGDTPVIPPLVPPPSHAPRVDPTPVSSQADPAQTRTETVDDEFNHLFEPTIHRSAEDAAIREIPDERLTASPVPDPAPATEQLGDHDGHTIAAAGLAALRRQMASSETPTAIQPVMARGARLEISTGMVVELDRDVVIGRRPEVDRVELGRVPTVVTVPSPRQDVSRTHVRIGWTGRQVMVTDLHSMNGTVLIGADGVSRPLVGGVSESMVDGDALDLGDGIVVTLRFVDEAVTS